MDPNILSLLEKISNPISSLNIHINIHGVFNPPQNWKIVQQTYPTYFTYTCQIFDLTIQEGKIIPRRVQFFYELTQKQIKQAQQAKEKKKNPKKESKVQEEKKEPSSQEYELELKKQQQWDALSPEQQRFRTLQDQFKSFSLKFPNPIIDFQLKQESLDKFEQAGFCEIILIRKPAISEEQVMKVKKAKPKGLVIDELVPLIYKGKIILQQFNVPGISNIKYRSVLQQVIQENSTVPKISLQNSYIYVEIILDNPFMPFIQQLRPTVEQLIGEDEKQKRERNLIRELKGQLILALKTINLQYTQQYQKQTQYQQKKATAVYANMKNIEINKKKDQFLTQFVLNGKYKLLKDRFRTVLQTIILDKFQKNGNFMKINNNQKNALLAELEVILRQLIHQTINQFLTKQPLQIHQDIIFSHQYIKSNRAKHIQILTNQTTEQHYLSAAQEYQMINQIQNAQVCLQNLVLLVQNSQKYLQLYGNFCLRHKMFEKGEILIKRSIEASSIHKSQKNLLLAALYIRRHRKKQALKLLKEELLHVEEQKILIKNRQNSTIQKLKDSMILRKSNLHEKNRETSLSILFDKQIDNIPYKLISILLIQFLYQRENQAKLAEKYKIMAEMQYKKHIGLITDYQKKKPNNPLQFKTYFERIQEEKEQQRKGYKLNQNEKQQLKNILYNFLGQHNLFDMMQLPLKNELLHCKYLRFYGQYNQALEILQKLQVTEQSLLLRGQICFIAGIFQLKDKMYECEQVFLQIKIKKLIVFMRLGWIYLQRKAWSDAQHMFLKALQLKQNSFIAWLGLGKACKNLEKYYASQQALNQANLFNPSSQQVLSILKQLPYQQQLSNG